MDLLPVVAAIVVLGFIPVVAFLAAASLIPRPRFKRPALRVPPAEETRASVDAFHRAWERFELLEFIWDRYDRGALLWARPQPVPARARARRRSR